MTRDNIVYTACGLLLGLIIGSFLIGPKLARTKLAGAEPTAAAPVEAAMLAETVERLLNMLEGRNREILTLTLQGDTPAEISARLRCTERTVYRVLERAKQWLEAAASSE